MLHVQIYTILLYKGLFKSEFKKEGIILKFKRLFSVIAAFTMAFSIGCTVVNADSLDSVVNEQIEARYSDFDSVSAGFGKASNGLYTAGGSAAAANGTKTIKLTVSIEKFDMNTSEWTAVKYCTWTASGVGVVTAGGDRSISGGFFRTHTVAKIYSSS